MNILYDFEIEDYQDIRSLSPLTEKALSEIRDFLIQRFSVLSDEMEIEERNNSAFVVIQLSENNIGYNYSASLIEKLRSCLSQEDRNYLNLRLVHVFASFNN